ncbi:MAG: BtrH N-terminal domain-containing protein [Chlorobi bacterium]|nr:BtrH N-terminal domain-containing protein [Chlorobiota bacterium]
MNNIIDFNHKMSAHCENGVTANLLRFYGVDLSEPVIFGIGSGLFFSYMPFIKMNGIPVTSFRPLPGMIFKRVTERLGAEVKIKRFRNKAKSMSELDDLIKKNIPVGMVVGVYDLTYFPPAYRFRFNAHNIIVTGKENNTYLVSDPIMEKIEKINSEDLLKTRFAKGTYKPRGKMYYIKHIPENYDLKSAVIKGIKHTCKDMLTIPVPYFGLKGITTLAHSLKKWPEKLGDKKAKLYLGQVIRMQEEIGTGGAGFRFLYAAFLQEASEITGKQELNEISLQMTEAGDLWRKFGIEAGRIFKGRYPENNPYKKISELLLKIKDKEEKTFINLNKTV